MRIVSWNIRHGGTKTKLTEICSQLEHWKPDVVGLSEFRESATSQAIAESLAEMGLAHQLTTAAAAERGRNFLLLASRFPLKVQPSDGLLNSSGRWLHAVTNDVHVMLMHVPNRSEEKWQFHEEVIEQFTKYRSAQAVAMGDTNTGQPGLDEESKFFLRKEGAWMEEIKAAGWQDVWRKQNPDGREFTWYSNHGNGFRLDQVFVTSGVAQSMSKVRYDWGKSGREGKLSDHAAIVFKINDDMFVC